MYGGQSTDASTTEIYLNNTQGSFFEPAPNSVFYFQSDTIAVRTGGTATGNPGDYISWVERGVVKNSTRLGIQRSQTLIGRAGTTTGWDAESVVSGDYFKQQVTGATGVTIEWASTIRITEIRTSVTLT